MSDEIYYCKRDLLRINVGCYKIQGIFLSMWRLSYRIVTFHEKFRFETILGEALTSFRVRHLTC